jgi:hypothetical protein
MLGHQLLDIAIAEGEAVVQLHTVADNLGWEAMTLIQIGGKWCAHAVSMPHQAETVHTTRLI